MPRLVLIHGRSQENKDAAGLKAEWIEAWRAGLDKNGLRMPLAESDIAFPFYGDTLYALAKNIDAGDVPDVILKGDGTDRARQEFIGAIVTEIAERRGITDEEVALEAGADVREKGLLNNKWVRAILKVIDRKVPLGSGTAIALFTNDVYQYLRNPGVRDRIETGVRAAMRPKVPTVVVGHSLGSIVAYNLLKRDGEALDWKVPLFLTVGSPLGVTQIYKSLRPVRHPACAERWYNAMDPRDVVALYPLTKDTFDIDPAIENKVDVRNDTSNRHGITGYLSDPEVARRIHDAVTA